MTAEQIDVVEVVLEQHKDVAERLAAVLHKTGDDRSSEFTSLAEFLAGHEAAEESAIYPELRKLSDDGVKIADERTHEEGAAADLLVHLKSLDTSSGEFESAFAQFASKVHLHATAEENTVVPMLTSSFSSDQRGAMGAAFLAAQQTASSST
jgi:hemerythrin superfamily protein